MSKLFAISVILFTAHPASFTHNFVTGMQFFFISVSPRLQWYCKLVMKNSVLDS